MTDDRALEAVVDRVAELLRLRVGLRPDSSLRGRLRRCIRDEATAYGQDPTAYANMLTTSESAVQGLLNQVTVQETSFFRHPEHFQVIARDILPRLVRPVTIWSAGCANGQEAFSLAIVLEELGVAGSVIATDLSTSALQRTVAATYQTRELNGLSPVRVARHLTKTNHGWRINENLRKRVITLRHNLIEPIPEQARCSQLVLCRNVLIYFSAADARTFLDRVATTLPAAEVFLGAAETMWSVSDRYETVRVDDTFYHRPQTATRARAKQPIERSPVRAVRDMPSVLNRRPPALAPTVPKTDTADAAALATVGQQALDGGDHRSAVAAFRKCVYLSPDNALAHLHLGLALEASGDNSAAVRAFGSARRAVLATGGTQDQHALGGYATTELLRLLDTKRQATTP